MKNNFFFFENKAKLISSSSVIGNLVDNLNKKVGILKGCSKMVEISKWNENMLSTIL